MDTIKYVVDHWVNMGGSNRHSNAHVAQPVYAEAMGEKIMDPETLTNYTDGRRKKPLINIAQL